VLQQTGTKVPQDTPQVRTKLLHNAGDDALPERQSARATSKTTTMNN